MFSNKNSLISSHWKLGHVVRSIYLGLCSLGESLQTQFKKMTIGFHLKSV